MQILFFLERGLTAEYRIGLNNQLTHSIICLKESTKQNYLATTILCICLSPLVSNCSAYTPLAKCERSISTVCTPDIYI